MNTTLRLCHSVPAPTRLPGFGPRFRFWRGASGRRYLFTEIGGESLGHFSGVVAVLADRRVDGALDGRGVAVLEGEDEAAALLRQAGPVATVFVHFMADTESARQAVLDDLSGAEPAIRAAA